MIRKLVLRTVDSFVIWGDLDGRIAPLLAVATLADAEERVSLYRRQVPGWSVWVEIKNTEREA